MAGNEIDRIRTRSVLDVVKQHPLMVLFAVSPVIAAAILVGWLTHPVFAVLLLVVAAATGTWAVVRRR